MTELPDWPPGTVAILATAGDHPHAIPVSTAVRTGPREVRFALAPRRESLARLRADARCALAILADGVAVTLHGRATVTGEAAGVVLLRLDVDDIQDHDQPTFEIDAGVRWRWTDPAAEERDAKVRAALLG
jgi:flavin reductase (DIM6/NTAB) family NADH-FMN oxidoreductase RutF